MLQFLRGWFLAVLGMMLLLTVVASLERNVVDAFAALWPDAWFRATLADAYFAFLTIWTWVAYKEPTWPRRLVWLAAFLLMGNFAIAAYVLLQLSRVKEGEPAERVLLRAGRGE